MYRYRKSMGIDQSRKRNYYVNEKIQRLQSFGFTQSSIAEMTGVSRATLHNIASRKYLTSDWRLFEQLNDIQYMKAFETVQDGHYVPAYPTVRRMQALSRIGWTNGAILEELRAEGLEIYQVKTWYRLTNHILIENHSAMERVYDRLSLSPGPSNRARLAAQSKGWASPLSWDNILDPFERPKGLLNATQ